MYFSPEFNSIHYFNMPVGSFGYDVIFSFSPFYEAVFIMFLGVSVCLSLVRKEQRGFCMFVLFLFSNEWAEDFFLVPVSLVLFFLFPKSVLKS